jgi:hypothetical protein
MYHKYAAVLRDEKLHNKDQAMPEERNKYVTTIFCIVSGIIKLSKIMCLPADRWVIFEYITVTSLTFLAYREHITMHGYTWVCAKYWIPFVCLYSTKLTRIPNNLGHMCDCRFVWRGLKDIELPQGFLVKNAMNFRGGVERSMLSTTRKKEVAVQVVPKYVCLLHSFECTIDMDSLGLSFLLNERVWKSKLWYYARETLFLGYLCMKTCSLSGLVLQYSKGGATLTLFKIDFGAVDRGANVKFLSQYPEEDEILYPPFSYLEVVGKARWPGQHYTRNSSGALHAWNQWPSMHHTQIQMFF